MRSWLLFLATAIPSIAFAALTSAQDQGLPNLRPEAQQIFALANQARATAGVGKLEWDSALAEAALAHCRRMAQEGPIAHRYGGEPDVATRAANAGARFGVIEENVAVGPTAEGIHNEWMNSPGHRSNLLSADVNRVGVAVVAIRGVLYAVADYSHDVPALSAAQVEARVADLIRVSGIAIHKDPGPARAACSMDSGVPKSNAAGPQPRFVMRWQDSDLSHLPQPLIDRLGSGGFHEAAVGSCPPRDVEGSFTVFRVAVLLY